MIGILTILFRLSFKKAMINNPVINTTVDFIRPINNLLENKKKIYTNS